MNSWNHLTLSAADVRDASLQCHHAAQYIGLVGRHIIPQRPDDSNTNMVWDTKLEMMIGNPINNKLHVALCPADLSIAVLDEEHHVLEMLELHGNTFDAGLTWLGEALTKNGVDASKLTRELHYEIPAHPVGEGAAFALNNAAAFAEIGYLYDNGHQAVTIIDGMLAETVGIAVWPHHFDIGSFAIVAKDAAGEMQNTIGFGLAPADEAVNEFYFYLTTWDKAGPVSYDNAPQLPAGSWNSNNWNGAVLKQSDMLQAPTAEAQLSMVLEFARAALTASEQLMNLQD